MRFTLEQFGATRPYLYHLTARANLARITQTWHIQSAEGLMREAGNPNLPFDSKRGRLEVVIDKSIVILRDQDPLYQGNIAFEDGWNFKRFIRLLNGHVFFWAGKADGPNDYGVRHYERYQAERPVILRVKFNELVGTNPDHEPLFCRYNSGSPRCSNGEGSPRGSRTFVKHADADFTPSNAREVVLASGALLPDNVEIADKPAGPWKPLLRRTGHS